MATMQAKTPGDDKISIHGVVMRTQLSSDVKRIAIQEMR